MLVNTCQCAIRVVVLGILWVVTVQPSFGQAASWPQWRGPSRDGHDKSSQAWPAQLDDTNFKQLWRVELQPSYSGPIVTADRVFVTETRDKKNEVVQALSLTDGSSIWTYEWPGSMTVPFFAASNGDWIRATPAYDGTSLYVGGMRDLLVCLDADTGKERWRVDFAERFKTQLPAFGFVSSPLVDGEYLYVQAGGSFVKLNKSDGSTVWRTLADGGGMNGSAFSSPVKAQIGDRTQLIVQTRERLAGVDDATGSELWSQNIEAFRGMNILTPTVIDDSVFTSSYGGKTWLFSLKSNNPANQSPDSYALSERWQNKAQGYMSTPVVIDGYIYLHLRNQRFTCIEAATGETRWTTEPFGKYWSLVAQGQQILALDERGDLLLIKANPQKFEPVNQLHVSNSPAWAHLAVCDGRVFVRDLNGLTVYQWSQAPAAQ
jgi:outer membrane protein assembly factor BamB